MKNEICPKCGNELEKDLKVCSNCGYNLEENGAQTINSKPDEVKSDSSEEDVTKENNKEKMVDKLEKKETESIVTETKIFDTVEQQEQENKKLSKGLFKRIKKSKIIIGVVIIGLIGFIIYELNVNNKLVVQYNGLVNDYNSLLDQFNDMKSKNTELTNQISQLNSENDELKNGASKQLTDVKNAYEQNDWNKVIELAKALHEKYNGSEEDKQAQELANSSQQKLNEAAAAKAAEEAKGYETGITYDQLARTPDDYKGQKVKFSGKVIQVIEGDNSISIRLAVNDDYDNILLGQYSKTIVSSRVLEDDHITIYGSSVGTVSYKSTMGGTITIPGVSIDKIDQ